MRDSDDSAPEIVAAGGVALKNHPLVAEKGSCDRAVKGPVVGHLTAGSKVMSHDGLHYFADLLETVPKIVVLSVHKNVTLKVGAVTSELTGISIVHTFDENSGDTTGDAIKCCGRASGTGVLEEKGT